MRPNVNCKYCGNVMQALQNIMQNGNPYTEYGCPRCAYRLRLPDVRLHMSEYPEVQYRFTVPADCCKEVKHVLLAGAGHMYCWKCGIGITEESSIPNPPWPVGRALQRLMASSLQLLPHVNMYASNTQGSILGHIQEIKESISEIERLTGLIP